MGKTPTKTENTPDAGPKAPAVPKVHQALRDPALTRQLAARITELQGAGGHLQSFIEELKAEKRLTSAFTGGAHQVRMLGLAASATQDERMAVINWSNAARRMLAKAGL